MNIQVIDPGHKYKLPSLDGRYDQVLTFVKRCDLENPERFPGNTNAHPGCTLQFVLRALIDRVCYLQHQIACWENTMILCFLGLSIWLLERRAARRHGRPYRHGIRMAVTSPMCYKCGHTFCGHEQPTSYLNAQED
jgi:hypothetical protein